MKGTTLVVGQGLAGTLVSYGLYRDGRKFIVMDPGREDSASWVAAGMWNPIGFRRLGFTWRVQEFLPVMIDTYREMEQLSGIPFAYEMPVQKKIPGAEYVRDWERLRSSGDYSAYLSPLYAEARPGEKELQWGDVYGSGYLDLPQVLSWWRQFLMEKGWFLEESADYSQFSEENDGVLYQGEYFDRIIFCEGINGLQNKWLPNLPVQKNKGEVLSLNAEGFTHSKILNNGKFLLDMGGGRLKLGSTYEWWKEDTTAEPTNRELLLQKAAEMLPHSFTITDHRAGLRPTVSDRRPLVGRSPVCRNMWLLNGLGTRGVMIGPYWAQYLLDMIFGNKPPDPETDPARFGG